MESEEIRVGDRFRHRSGFVVEVRGPKNGGLWPLQVLGGAGPEVVSGALDQRVWWTPLPRAEPTTENRCALCNYSRHAVTECPYASIEARRAALKPGDVIRDPALLKEGMRVYTGQSPSGYTRVIAAISSFGWATFSDGWSFRPDSVRRGEGWERVTFLGWASEGDPPKLCNAEQCDHHHEPSDPACVRAKHRRPVTPPRALPFKRHPFCYMPSIHVVEVMCMGCEAAIARETARLPIINGHSLGELIRDGVGQPSEPSTSGLGGVVGHVLSQLR